MQTTAIGTVTNSLPENEVILLTLLISKTYIPYTDLHKISESVMPKSYLFPIVPPTVFLQCCRRSLRVIILILSVTVIGSCYWLKHRNTEVTELFLHFNILVVAEKLG